MKVLGLGWLGVRTERYQEMVAFYRDVFGLTAEVEEGGFALFSLPDGDRLELFGPESEWNRHFDERPVGGILVDDVPEFVAAMEARGIEFVHVGGDRMVAWAHFRAPDGNLYEICHDRRRPR
jgi:catechol 2,3-dioxygenase-like lactoylglutathione lyase family enzyme